MFVRRAFSVPFELQSTSFLHTDSTANIRHSNLLNFFHAMPNVCTSLEYVVDSPNLRIVLLI